MTIWMATDGTMIRTEESMSSFELIWEPVLRELAKR